MTLRSPALYTGGEAHPPDGDRHLIAALLGSPAQGVPQGVTPVNVGGGHGVVGPDDFRVVEDTGANRSVTILAGHAFVRGAKTAGQGVYALWNDSDAQAAVTLEPGEGNPRRDLVAVKVTDGDYGDGATQPPEFVVIKGTASPNPVDPDIPDDASYLVLARVDVPATPGFAVTNGIIRDRRPYAVAAGGVMTFTSTNRPTGLRPGTLGWESDTQRLVRWTGTAWQAESVWWSPSAGNLPSQPYLGQIAIDGPFGGDQASRIPKFWNGQKWVSLGIGSLRWRTLGQRAGSAPADRDNQPLFLQAGSVQATSTGGGYVIVQFPSPFPNGLVWAQGFVGSLGPFDPAVRVMVSSLTLRSVSFRIMNVSAQVITNYPLRIDWLAVGY